MVGGGAAGLVAAWRAASLGARTRLLERNPRLGLKIHISGGGKCNITHAGEMEQVRRAFRPAEARFLHHAFRRFTNEEVLDLVRARGVRVHTRPDGRVFPDSGRADDVVEALIYPLRTAGVSVELGVSVERLLRDGDRIRGAASARREYAARTVLLAVGGSSYPKTGSTGDGYRWARELGHTIVPLRAALAPLYLRQPRPEWSGVALRACLLRARGGGKELARWEGDLLFTHHGVSGPTALGVSREAALGLERGPVTLDVDAAPDWTSEALTEAFTGAHSQAGRRPVRALLQRWLPERLTEGFATQAGVEAALPLHQLSRKQRLRLVEALKRWDLGPVRTVPLERGEVTAGGVALEEVDPRTMASRRVPGLFLCGEILDIAGPIGGYNLQAAFSTGYVAGEGAVELLGR